MPRIDVSDAANALAVEEAVEVEAGDEPALLCRTDDGLFAVSGICTHAFARLVDGFVIDRYIECPLHQAQFDLSTGERVSGPDCESLCSYAVVTDGDKTFIEVSQKK